MKIKNFVAVLFVLASLLVACVAVQAIPTNTQVVLVPASSSTQMGTVTFKAEVNGSMYACSGAGCTAPWANVSQVGFNVTPSGGSAAFACINKSNVNNGTVINWTCNYNSNTLSDATTYTVTAVIYNGTGANLLQRNTTTSTGVKFDNSVPTVNFTTPTTGNTTETGLGVSGSCINASSAVLTWGGTTYTMTMGGSAGAETCTYNFGINEPAKRIYDDVMITATDTAGSNSTSCSAIEVTVDEVSTAGRAALIAQAASEQGLGVEVGEGSTLSIGSDAFGGLGSIWSGSTLDWAGLVLVAVGLLSFVVPIIPPPINLGAVVVGLLLVVLL